MNRTRGRVSVGGRNGGADDRRGGARMTRQWAQRDGERRKEGAPAGMVGDGREGGDRERKAW